MLPTDPPPTQWDLHFGVFGIPVRVHPLFWLVALFLGLRVPDPVTLLTWILAVFVSILAHEFGHAVVMRAYGYQPSITLYAMGGYTAYGPSVFGAREPGGWPHVVISAAGPATGFALAALLVWALRAAGVGVRVDIGLPHLVDIGLQETVWSPAFSGFIYHLFFINVFWGLVNLLPIYPLDGGQISREILTQLNPWNGVRWSLMLSLVVAALVAVFAVVQWQSILAAVFFGYLAYGSYATLAMYSGPGRW